MFLYSWMKLRYMVNPNGKIPVRRSVFVWLCFTLYVCLCLCLSLSLFVSRCFSLPILYVFVRLYVSLCPSLYLFVLSAFACLSVCLSLYLSFDRNQHCFPSCFFQVLCPLTYRVAVPFLP